MDFFQFDSPACAKSSLHVLRRMFENVETRVLVGGIAETLHCEYSSSLQYSEQDKAVAMRRAVQMMKQYSDDEDEVVDDASKLMAFLCGQCTRPNVSLIITFQHTELPEIKLHLPEFSTADVGFRLWGASLLISRLVVEQTLVNVSNKCVVELGAASGLCGITSLYCGAKHVYITDFNQACLDCAQRNVIGGNDRASVMFMDWTQSPSNVAVNWQQCVVLGAAVVYEEKHAREIAALLVELFNHYGISSALIAVHLAHSGFEKFQEVVSHTLPQFKSAQVYTVTDDIGADRVAAFYFSA